MASATACCDTFHGVAALIFQIPWSSGASRGVAAAWKTGRRAPARRAIGVGWMSADDIFPDATVPSASSGAGKFAGAQCGRRKPEPLHVAIGATDRSGAWEFPAGRPAFRIGSRFARF